MQYAIGFLSDDRDTSNQDEKIARQGLLSQRAMACAHKPCHAPLICFIQEFQLSTQD
jgi:hypothetical protein